MSRPFTDDSGAQLLAVEGLTKHFAHTRGVPFVRQPSVVRAVDGVSFGIRECETVSVVGESGSGKTTLTRLILGLERPTAGTVHFDGVDITTARSWNGVAPIQAVFQDPWSSLDPRMRARHILAEPLVAGGESRAAITERVDELLAFVGLDPGAGDNYPHEFSGGQRQRLAIARALSVRPRLIVLDEPVSALDVSIRAQIINLLGDVQEDVRTSYLMIAHDLATVRSLSDIVLVMYLGVIVDRGPVDDLFDTPLHPYSRALLSASLPLIPGLAPERIRLKGEIPSPVNPPSGCRFRTRCPFAFERCAEEVPLLRTGGAGPTHLVACHLYDEAHAAPLATASRAAPLTSQ